MSGQRPSVGRVVHYVAHGTPIRADGTQAYQSVCRAAIITEVDGHDPTPEHGMPYVGLCVLNPTGQFFNQHVKYHDGSGDPGDPNCPGAQAHGNPFRYCACGWTEPTLIGGTWHWCERV